MKIIAVTVALSFAAALSVLAQSANQPDVSGTWVAQTDGNLKWLLTEKDGNLHVVEMNGSRVETDFTCPLSGQECTAKFDGHTDKMMTYYNGDKLVEIRESHDGVIKTRLSLSADGKTLTAERVPLSASEKTETTLFRRTAT